MFDDYVDEVLFELQICVQDAMLAVNEELQLNQGTVSELKSSMREVTHFEFDDLYQILNVEINASPVHIVHLIRRFHCCICNGSRPGTQCAQNNSSTKATSA